MKKGGTTGIVIAVLVIGILGAVLLYSGGSSPTAAAAINKAQQSEITCGSVGGTCKDSCDTDESAVETHPAPGAKKNLGCANLCCVKNNVCAEGLKACRVSSDCGEGQSCTFGSLSTSTQVGIGCCFGKGATQVFCHMPGTPEQKTMELPLEAAKEHIERHGDTLGPCCGDPGTECPKGDECCSGDECQSASKCETVQNGAKCCVPESTTTTTVTTTSSTTTSMTTPSSTTSSTVSTTSTTGTTQPPSTTTTSTVPTSSTTTVTQSPSTTLTT